MDGEDAEATLHAVLSFLDECELAEAAELLEEQEDASQQLQGDGAPAKPKKRRRPSTRPRGYKSNRTRDERRFELMRLRQNVVSLEKELEQLRTQESSRRQQAEPKSGGSSSSSHSSSAQSPSSSAPDPTLFLWEDIALGQMNQRKRAELENARLKNSLEQQIKVAKALQKLIYRRAAWEEVLKGHHRPSSTGSAAQSNETKFQDLIEGAERALANVDAIMLATGLRELQKQFSDARVRVGENGGMVLEIVSTKLLPFDVKTTGKAVWRHFAHSMESMPSRVYYPKHVETTGDTVMEQFNLEIASDTTKAGYRVRQVLRKREDEHRVLIGWRCMMEMTSFADEPTTGILLHEDGYVVIEQARQATADADMTLMQMCYIITPDIYMHNASRMGALTDFILHTVMRTIQASHQLIENFLLDQALKTGSNSIPILQTA